MGREVYWSVIKEDIDIKLRYRPKCCSSLYLANCHCIPPSSYPCISMCMVCSLDHHISPISIQLHREHIHDCTQRYASFSLFDLFILEARNPTYKYLLALFLLSFLPILSRVIFLNFFSTYQAHFLLSQQQLTYFYTSKQNVSCQPSNCLLYILSRRGSVLIRTSWPRGVFFRHNPALLLCFKNSVFYGTLHISSRHSLCNWVEGTGCW